MFLEVKFSIYLNRRVFVMQAPRKSTNFSHTVPYIYPKYPKVFPLPVFILIIWHHQDVKIHAVKRMVIIYSRK